MFSVAALLFLSGLVSGLVSGLFHEPALEFDQTAQKNTEQVFQVQAFSSLYEPSGITALNANTFLVVEDEPEQALHLLRLAENSTLHVTGDVRKLNQELRLNDLEGAAFDGQYAYVISSHSLTKKGKKGKFRRVFARFEYVDNTFIDARVIQDLYSEIYDAIYDLLGKRQPRLEKNTLNEMIAKLDIEALMWAPNSRSLLLGLRAPLIEGKSVVLQIKNADDIFRQKSAKGIDITVYLLDLKQQGIRGMDWNAPLKRIMLVTGQSNRSGDSSGDRSSSGSSGRTKPDQKHQLWSWTGAPEQAPELVLSDLPNGTEGLKILTLDEGKQRQMMMIVIDDGSQKRLEFGHYQMRSLHH